MATPQTNFELKRKLLQLEALHDVGRALNTLRPEGELLEELMHRAISVLDATTGFAFSLDEKLNIQSIFTFEITAAPDTFLAEPPVREAAQNPRDDALAALEQRVTTLEQELAELKLRLGTAPTQ